MKIPMLVFGFVAISTGLHCDNKDDRAKQCEGCCSPSCCCQSPTPPESVHGTAFTPQWYNMSCNCGVFLTADFLYWYGRETDLSYGIKGKTRNNNDLLSTTYQFSASEMKYLHAKWKPGVRIGLGLNGECDGWDLYLYWTYYYNKSNQTTSVPEFATGYPGLGSSGLVNPWVSRPIFVGILFDQISAEWKFEFNSFDIELGRRYWVSQCLTIRPFTGLRGARTWTEFDVRGERIGFGGSFSSTTSDDFTSKDEFKNTFWGVGLTGGIQPTWFFSDCFSLYGNMDIALLWGQHKVKKEERYTDTQTSLTSAIVTQLANYRANTSSDSYYLQPFLDLAIGLRWENYYCQDQYHVALDLGWENHILFHLNDRYQINGNVIEYTLASGVTGEGFDTYNQTHHDVSFGGLVLRVRFDF